MTPTPPEPTGHQTRPPAQPTETEQRFTLIVARAAGAIGGLVGVVVAVSEITRGKPGTRVFGAFLLVACGYFFVRSLLSATVILAPSELRLRSIVSTKRIPINEISGATSDVGRTGFNGIGRQYLIVEKTDGTSVAFKELNCVPSHDDNKTTIVAAAVQAINAAASTTTTDEHHLPEQAPPTS